MAMAGKVVDGANGTAVRGMESKAEEKAVDGIVEVDKEMAKEKDGAAEVDMEMAKEQGGTARARKGKSKGDGKGGKGDGKGKAKGGLGWREDEGVKGGDARQQ